MKCSSKTLQYLLYFWNVENSCSIFCYFHFMLLGGKINLAQKEKRRKLYVAKFKAFHCNFSSSINHWFVKSVSSMDCNNNKRSVPCQFFEGYYYQGIKELRRAGREGVRDKFLENSGGVNQEEIFSLYKWNQLPLIYESLS